MQLDPTTSASNLIRTAWGKNEFPVDPVTIARNIGVKVVDAVLPPSVSGALIKETGKDATIMLHREDSKNRKRFSCAHELGHYISRVESADYAKEYEFIDLRSDNSSSGSDPEEVFANKFAACLIMPEFAVRELYKRSLTHVEMALFFGVSNEAMKFRLNNLDLLK